MNIKHLAGCLALFAISTHSIAADVCKIKPTITAGCTVQQIDSDLFSKTYQIKKHGTHLIFVKKRIAIKVFGRKCTLRQRGESDYTIQGNCNEYSIAGVDPTAGNGGPGGNSTFTSVDIGSTKLAGSTTINGSSYTIKASGNDIAGPSDSFHYHSTPLKGDGQITAKLESVTNNDVWTKTGVMIRDTLTGSSPNAFFFMRPAGEGRLQYREATSGTTRSKNNGTNGHENLSIEKWIRLTREGKTFTSYSSDDGLCWERQKSVELNFTTLPIHYGIALTSHASNELATAKYSNVEVSSTVEPLNTNCDRAKIDGAIPAPTWIMPPGKFASALWQYSNTQPSSVWKTAPTVSGSNWQDVSANLGSESTDHYLHPRSTILPRPAKGTTGNTTYRFRRTFTLTDASQMDELVFWARWKKKIKIYIDGVEANYLNTDSRGYRYIGLKKSAIGILKSSGNVVGDHVIAVEITIQGERSMHFDLGIGLAPKLTDLPVITKVKIENPRLNLISARVKKFMEEYGMSGGAVAVMSGGDIVLSQSFGYRDKNLNVTMAKNPVMRIASLEKPITAAIAAKRVNDGHIDFDQKAFKYLKGHTGEKLGKGTNIDEITLEQILYHNSCMGGKLSVQEGAEKMSFQLGTTPAKWTKEDLLSWLYSRDTIGKKTVGGKTEYKLTQPGTERNKNEDTGDDENFYCDYSSDAYFVLRYMLNETLPEISKGESAFLSYIRKTIPTDEPSTFGFPGIHMASERIIGRHSSEPAYITNRIYARWTIFEEYFSLSSTPEELTHFFRVYDAKFETDDASGRFTPKSWGWWSGAMDGTYAYARYWKEYDVSIALLFNNSGPKLVKEDTKPSAGGILTDKLISPTLTDDVCGFKGANELDPESTSVLFMRNDRTQGYVGRDPGDTFLIQDRDDFVDGQARALWRFVPTGTEDVFQIINDVNGRSLFITNGGNLATGSVNADNAHWIARRSPTGSFTIQNVMHDDHYLNSLSDRNIMNASAVSPSSRSAQWTICDIAD